MRDYLFQVVFFLTWRDNMFSAEKVAISVMVIELYYVMAGHLHF